MDIINIIKSLAMPKQKKVRGGYTFNMLDEIQQSLGKVLVYYRVRYQQPVEIFERLDIPSNFDKAVDMIRFNKVMLEQTFEKAMDMIPEYVTLRNTIAERSRITDDDIKKANGFELFPALFDPKTNCVITIHSMIPSDFFYELFDKKREKDVIRAIKKWSHTQVWFDT